MTEGAVRRVVILGAGYAGMRAALDIGRRCTGCEDVETILVDRNPYHQFRTELHKAAAGTAPGDVSVPIERILHAHPDVHFEQAEVTRIDVGGHVLERKDAPPLPFDKLAVAVGGEPETFDIPGLDHALSIQSVNSARVIRDHIEDAFRRAALQEDAAARRRGMTVIVGGGGLTGVEFVFELADRLPELCRSAGAPKEEARLILIEASSSILKGFDEHQIALAQKRLDEKQIESHFNVKITSVEPHVVNLDNGARLETDSFVWTGGVRGNHLVSQAMSCDPRGRARVNHYLQSIDCEDVFVAGDSALAIDAESGQPVGPTAQNAIQQGGLLAYNLCAALEQRPLKPYEPRNLGKVASLGPGYGVAHLGGLNISGLPAAWLKELIALHYVYSLGGAKLLLQQLVHA